MMAKTFMLNVENLSTNEDVEKVLKLVNKKEYKVTTFDVESIYREIYGIDIMKIKELKFGE